jgi:tRNA-dihydrouridine synthase B
MAGVTDRPFRSLCRAQGAGLVVSEMTTADETLWHTDKSRLRRDHAGEAAPIAVQIAGTEPEAMARAARFNVEHGAQIIDINMGCPAKKVCRVDAGSALMRDEPLVARILEAVVGAVNVPVTLKIRTGWARTHKNAVTIARIAEGSGIAALAVHGRTREDHYEGQAEYETIAAVKQSIAIPVLANGDIVDGPSARHVFEQTGVDALMIGRAAQGPPWIFRQIATYLATGVSLPEPSMEEAGRILLGHLDDLHDFYGEERGARVARKHIQWYCQSHPGSGAFWSSINQVACAKEQRTRVEAFFFGNAGLRRTA